MTDEKVPERIAIVDDYEGTAFQKRMVEHLKKEGIPSEINTIDDRGPMIIIDSDPGMGKAGAEMIRRENQLARARRPVMVGTIGHVDHGKTTLTAALMALAAREALQVQPVALPVIEAYKEEYQSLQPDANGNREQRRAQSAIDRAYAKQRASVSRAEAKARKRRKKKK